MIKVNGTEIIVEKYPDGTPRINYGSLFRPSFMVEKGRPSGAVIDWKFEGNDEVFYLILIKKHLDNNFALYANAKIPMVLNMSYIPNARMDRTKSDDEVFTLKYFCDIINSLNFDKVYVLDAHSDVSVALLNRCVNDDPKQYIASVIDEYCNKDNLVLYFPDAGAAKRYSGLFPEIRYCYGEKKRDWKTGKIQGLEIRTNELDLTGKDVLVIDDIVAFGGSIHFSAAELKKCGVNKIYAYATHTENSVLDREKGTLIKDLENGTVERLFTTNSLFTGKHEKITVMEV